MLRALAKDPAQRYADADEFIAALAARARSAARARGRGRGRRRRRPAIRGAAAAPAHAAHRRRLLLLPPRGGRRRGGRSPRRGRDGGAGAWLLWAARRCCWSPRWWRSACCSRPRRATVTVPNVVGQTEQAALARLRAAGLNPVAVARPRARRSRAAWWSARRRRAGSEVREGHAREHRRLRRSRQRGAADVEGLTAAEAVSKLRKAGFKPTTQAQASATVAQGHVIAHRPVRGHRGAGRQPRHGVRLERPRAGAVSRT